MDKAFLNGGDHFTCRMKTLEFYMNEICLGCKFSTVFDLILNPCLLVRKL